MKIILKKFLIALLMMTLIMNFVFSEYAHAAESVPDFTKIINGLLSSVVGIFTYPIKFVALAFAIGADSILGTIAYSQGSVDQNGNISNNNINLLVTPFDILFNKLALTDINFFNVNSNSDNVVYKIRSNIATWYYVMRNLAAAILLVVLIYIGIRMALSTVASEKAMYKKMLVDWTTSLALIFLVHYMALFIININNALVNSICSMASDGVVENYNKSIEQLMVLSFLSISVDSLAATVVYVMVIYQTVGLLISYFSRMLKIAFLMIISPLITLTYSIDKIGDGKAQALGNWLKEFVYTILIQPFHCIIYLTFISMAFNLLSANVMDSSIPCGVIAIMCLQFTKEAEKIVRNIFSFKGGEEASLASGLGVASLALSKAKGIGTGTRKAINGITSIGSTVGGMVSDASTNALAIGTMIGSRFGGSKNSGGGSDDGGSEGSADNGKMSFAEAKQAVLRDKVIKDEAKKIEKDNKNYKANKKATSTEINNKAKEIMKDSKGTLTMSQAKAQARLSIAQERRKEIDKAAEATGGKPARTIRGAVSGTIKSARNSIQAARDFYHNTKFLKGMVDNTIKGAGGLLIAGATLGDGKGLATAATAGTAAAKGIGAFLQNSTNTLATNVNDGMRSLDVKDEYEFDSKLDEIMLKGNNKGYNDKAFKALTKAVEKALEAAGLDNSQASDVRYQVQNKINKNITKNPGASINDIIKDALQSNSILKENGLSNNQGINSAFHDYTEANQEKAIFDTFNTAKDLGIETNRFANYAGSRYRGTGATSSNNGGTSTTTSSGTSTPEGATEREKQLLEKQKELEEQIKVLTEAKERLETEAASGTSNITDAQIAEIKAQIENEINSIENDIKDINDKIEEVEKDLKRKRTKVFVERVTGNVTEEDADSLPQTNDDELDE